MVFRDLKAEEIDVRIGQVNSEYKYFTLLLYKDARVDMDILDETVGAENWSRKHYSVKDNMYCSVGIKCGNDWVYKDDCGTESNTEKEKGESSDSFKRACVNWGIGRELYTAPHIIVNSEISNKKPTFLSRFSVESITIESKKITALEISAYNKDLNKREVIFTYGKTHKKESLTEKKCEQKPLTLAQAKILKVAIGDGEIALDKLTVTQLESLIKSEKPEYQELKEPAKLVLEFKNNGK